jgi:P-type Cu+ transporter
MKSNGIDYSSVETKITEFEKTGKTTVLVAKDEIIIGVIAISDSVKETSKVAVDTLYDMGLDIFMITGDNRHSASVVGKR